MPLGKIGKYEKLDVLGHGVSGIVYLAWDSLLGKHVALKEISLQAADESRFLEEARVLDRLRHPNIVQVNGVDKIDGHMVIDMEYVKGTNLHEYMRRHRKLPVTEALSVAVQICDALDFAHSNHTVHRDIKPANILLSETGQAKIVDFGLAEILGSGSYAGGAGTYAYMAPEDFEEEERSDHRSDIWSVGVTLYEMLAGKRPFQATKAKDPFAWKRTVQEDEPVPVATIDPSLPADLQQVIGRALAKDKYDRYQSAGQFRDDLRRILAGLGADVVPVGANPAAATRHLAEPEGIVGVDVILSPEELDFGRVRQGETKALRLLVRVPGHGRTNGRVASQPGWLSVSPQAFNRRKQSLELTADTETIWKPGAYDGRLVLDIEGETVNVQAVMDVLPARRRFHEVAWWYVPVFGMCLLPVLSPVFSSREVSVALALITMGLLSAMLFIISMAADLGILEKLAPAVIAAIGLGAMIGAARSVAERSSSLNAGQIGLISAIGVMLCLLIVVQLVTASRWRFWTVVLMLVSLGAFAVLSR